MCIIAPTTAIHFNARKTNEHHGAAQIECVTELGSVTPIKLNGEKFAYNQGICSLHRH